MPRVCVFDVNETLLDLSALDPHFERIFGDAAVRRAWFNQVLQSAFVSTITDAYADFSTIGRAALQMMAERHGIALSDQQRQDIQGAIRALPAHPEAQESLRRLRDGGLRLAALTNSPLELATTQLTNAGLYDLFERVFSADEARRLKPASQPYHMAAARLGVAPGAMRLIAAHAWDVEGAMRAGCAAAFVARPGQVLDPRAERPDIVGSDLRVVADAILSREAI